MCDGCDGPAGDLPTPPFPYGHLGQTERTSDHATDHPSDGVKKVQNENVKIKRGSFDCCQNAVYLNAAFDAVVNLGKTG